MINVYISTFQLYLYDARFLIIVEHFNEILTLAELMISC